VMKIPRRLRLFQASPGQTPPRRYLSGQSSKYVSSRTPVQGIRRRDGRRTETSPNRGQRADGGGSSFARRREEDGARVERVAVGTGFKAERRRMAAEFAEMRQADKEMFWSPDSIKLSSSSATKKLPSKTSRQPSVPRKTAPLTKNAQKPTSKVTPALSPKPPAKSPSKLSSKEPSKSFSKSLHIPIILESPEFVCISKPPGLLSQPGLPGEGTILTLLGYQRPDLKLQTVNRYISPTPLSPFCRVRAWFATIFGGVGIDGRLDKNTSGAMVLGRTEKSIRSLNLAFKQSQVEKNVSSPVGSPCYGVSRGFVSWTVTDDSILL